jgi:hypothetical protein
MHAQIRNVIEGLHFTLGHVSFDLTATEQTPLGRILYCVYYGTNITDVIDRNTRWGYPHNGGQHTFEYSGPWGDAVAMLELIKEVVSEKYGDKLDATESQVLSEFSYISQEIIAGRKKM